MSIRSRWLKIRKKRRADELQAGSDAHKARLNWLQKRKQRRAADRILKRHPPRPHGAAAAVKWAASQVGTLEQPAGSNAGPRITDWLMASIGITGVPWCQAFVNTALVHGGGEQLKSAFTPQVVQWGRDKKFGLSIVPNVNDRKPGDFVFFKWPGVSHDFCDHVGIYAGNGQTIEGNTSSGNSGSQNNGGGVFVRVRGFANVVAVVRPTYR
jgi:cell wall-associated NlpC family hydrolase